MPSPQAVVTFVAFLFVLLIGLHVPLEVPAGYAAIGSVILALGAGWIVDRRVPDPDDDVTEDARNAVPAEAASEAPYDDPSKTETSP